MQPPEPTDVQRHEQAYKQLRQASQTLSEGVEVLNDDETEALGLAETVDTVERAVKELREWCTEETDYFEDHGIGGYYYSYELTGDKHHTVRCIHYREGVEIEFQCYQRRTGGAYHAWITECVDAETGENIDPEALTTPTAEMWSVACVEAPIDLYEDGLDTESPF